jgi:hypothetical protein
MGLTRILYEDRLPLPGDPAEIYLYDFVEDSLPQVAETCARDTQAGVQLHWGRTDEELLFNSMHPGSGHPPCIRMDAIF